MANTGVQRREDLIDLSAVASEGIERGKRRDLNAAWDVTFGMHEFRHVIDQFGVIKKQGVHGLILSVGVG